MCAAGASWDFGESELDEDPYRSTIGAEGGTLLLNLLCGADLGHVGTGGVSVGERRKDCPCFESATFDDEACSYRKKRFSVDEALFEDGEGERLRREEDAFDDEECREREERLRIDEVPSEDEGQYRRRWRRGERPCREE